jgi:hypothetical protein
MIDCIVNLENFHSVSILELAKHLLIEINRLVDVYEITSCVESSLVETFVISGVAVFSDLNIQVIVAYGRALSTAFHITLPSALGVDILRRTSKSGDISIDKLISIFDFVCCG